ncbi:MAG TPA: hypothetical protein VJO32_16610 [Ktedonobacteraceae bacterium]|nr:hypothetical protein [Ktedonobacteraceae bacterium]
MKYSDAEALPPCEFSAHCLRLLDDLDAPDDEHVNEKVLSTDANDMQDEYLIEKLRVHVPGCPICSAKLAEARALRSRQRVALRRYLVDAESRVPSTIERILSMTQQTLPEEIEQSSAAQKRQRYILPQVFMPLIPPKSSGSSNGNGNGHIDHATDQQIPSMHIPGHWLRNGFALATAAALLFAALGIFSHIVLRSGTPASQGEAKSWPSVMIGVSLLSSLPAISKLYNVDTTSGERAQMTPTGMPAEEMRYETVSPDGKNVLYHFSAQGQIIYTTLQTEQSGAYVAQVPNGGVNNAIWMDNDHVLVAFAQSGVEEFDIHTSTSVQQFASLSNVSLLFYHAPYLYYQDAQKTVVYRSNLATGDRQQLLADAGGLNFTHCMLGPDGTGIYCEAQSDRFPRSESALYMVGNDGSGVRAFSQRGILLGFAPDHALLILQSAFNNFQVVKLGQTPQQDRVVMKNAAPATATIGAGDAMLAPDGHGLVVQDGNMADALRGVWYDDLTTQTSHELFTYTPGSYGQLIGWDQLRVNGTTPASAVTESPVTVGATA